MIQSLKDVSTAAKNAEQAYAIAAAKMKWAAANGEQCPIPAAILSAHTDASKKLADYMVIFGVAAMISPDKDPNAPKPPQPEVLLLSDDEEESDDDDLEAQLDATRKNYANQKLVNRLGERLVELANIEKTTLTAHEALKNPNAINPNGMQVDDDNAARASPPLEARLQNIAM